MNFNIYILLCVIVICITVITIKVIENYPEWSSFFEYKDKAKQYDNLQKQYCDEIKELSKTIDNIKRFGEKEYHAAFEYRNNIDHIKNIIKRISNTNTAIEEINKYLSELGL